MQKYGLIALALGLLFVLGGIGRVVYAIATAFAAAHEVPDGRASADATSFALASPMNLVAVGFGLFILGGALVLGGNRSGR